MQPPTHLLAPAACACYLALALLFPGRLPFVQFPIFQFPATQGPTVLPLFLADGERARIEDYTDFAGFDPESVDVAHAGFECSVEHKLYEQRHWLRTNQAESGDPPGPVRCEVGLQILAIGADGDLQVSQRIDGSCTARER